MKQLFILVLCAILTVPAWAQPTSMMVDRNKILKTAEEKYGITEENANISEQELIAELIKRGVDPTNEQAVEEAAVEIIRERQQKAGGTNSPVQGAGGGMVKSDLGTLQPKQDTSKLPDKPKQDLQEDAQKIIKEEPKEEIKITVDQKDAPTNKRIYGQDLPSNVSLQVDPKNINPKGSYIVGAGDEFGVAVYGTRSADFKLIVNEDGYASIPEVPGSRMYLKGVTYDKAKKIIRSRIGQLFNLNVANLEITLVYARTVTVHLMGEVNAKGTHVLSGVNTAFTALAAGEGLTDIASVRNIKLIRSGDGEKVVDLYRYMSDPIYGEDFYLQDNDYIIVPPVGRVVEVKGNVRRPAKYELIAGEGLKELVKYAAGLSANAYTKNVSITRIESNQKKLINVNLQAVLDGTQSFELIDGDIVTIVPINEYNRNVVEVTGELLYPGTYAFEAGRKLDYYIQKATLKEGARTDTIYVTRKYADGTVSYLKLSLDEVLKDANSPQNITMLPEDQIQVTAQSAYFETFQVGISGDIRKGELTLAYDSTLTIRDLIFLSGGLAITHADTAAIVRTDLATGKKEYIFFSLSDILNPASSLNATLQLAPKDEILVLNESAKIDKFDISISGAVRTPKSLAYDPALTVRDVIYLGGGLTLNASRRMIIERRNLKTGELQFQDVDVDQLLTDDGTLNAAIQLAPGDKLQVLSELKEDSYSVSIDGEVRKPGTFNWGEGLKLGDVIKLAGGIKPEAVRSRVEVSRIDISDATGATAVTIAQFEIDENLELPVGADFELERYDRIVVRSTPNFELQNTVTLSGEVKYPGTYVLLSKSETLLSVIERAGGLTEEAFPIGATFSRSLDERGEILLDLDNLMRRRNRSPFNYIMKDGDRINIPRKLDLVTLGGAVDNPKVAEAGTINIPYHKGRRAGYYVNRYGQGVDWENDGRRRFIQVEYPNGEVRETVNLGIATITPKVKKGSQIVVGVKPPKRKKEEKEIEREPVDWGEVVQNTITQITGVVTLYVLLQRAFN